MQVRLFRSWLAGLIYGSRFFEFPFHRAYWKYLRLAILMGLDVLFISLSYYLAFVFRLEKFLLGTYSMTFAVTLPVVLTLYLANFNFLGIYRIVWRQANFDSAVVIVKSVFFSVIAVLATVFWLGIVPQVPRSVPFIHGLLVVLAVTGHKFLWRYFLTGKARRSTTRQLNCLIYGAGHNSDLFVQHVKRSVNSPYHLLGFIDDDKNIRHRVISGLKVLGSLADMAGIVKDYPVDHLIISESLSGSGADSIKVRQVYNECIKRHIKPLILPDMGGSLRENLVSPRKVDISDLLKRAPRANDEEMLGDIFEGQTVLISGAGGSIGSEICRQVARFRPRSLVLVEISEYNLYRVEKELMEEFPDLPMEPVLGSITDRSFLTRCFGETKPSVVLHAAAYKHVPMVEKNILSGIINNVGGTKELVEVAVAFRVKRFLMISSDKAVRPTSTMGASKRVCELLVQAFHGLYGDQILFSLVRFGNVLGSSGSVIPLFLDQIAKGGPVTVTHREVRRYFMLVSEAVALVLRSLAINRGGETFVLDMGEPINIYEMAQQLIALTGKVPEQDIKIAIVGLRPGEKLYEELLLEGNEVITSVKDLFIARPEQLEPKVLLKLVDDLLDHCVQNDLAQAKTLLWDLVNSSNSQAAQPASPTPEQRRQQRMAVCWKAAWRRRHRPCSPASAPDQLVHLTN